MVANLNQSPISRFLSDFGYISGVNPGVTSLNALRFPVT